VVLPSFFIFALGREAQFPTLFFTFRRLHDRPGWRWIGTGLIAGLAILVFHLALYPWPNITNAPRRYAGLSATDARTKAQREIERLRAEMPKLSYSTQTRGIAGGRDAWLVFFSPAAGSGLDYSGCIVVVTQKAVSPTHECST
jgi:hypothetical protein